MSSCGFMAYIASVLRSVSSRKKNILSQVWFISFPFLPSFFSSSLTLFPPSYPSSKEFLYFWGITFCIQIHKTNTNQYKGGAVVENLPANARDSRDMGSISGLGRFTGVEKGNPLQWFCLGNSTDRGAKPSTVHWVAKSQTWPSAHLQNNNWRF